MIFCHKIITTTTIPLFRSDLPDAFDFIENDKMMASKLFSKAIVISGIIQHRE